MYVEIFQGHLFATERSPDVPGDVTWQWDEQNISYKDWTIQLAGIRTGTADLAVVIT